MRDWTVDVREHLCRASDGLAIETEIVEEIAQHVADVHRAALFKGCSHDEADALATRELDNIAPLAMAIRQRKRVIANRDTESPWAFAGLSRDILHAVRLLTARGGYSTVVVLTLAIGIGACTAVFSLLNSLLLGAWPYPDPERLVLLWETDAEDPSQQFIAAAPNYRD